MMSRSPAGPVRGRGLALPGRSAHTRTTSPAIEPPRGLFDVDFFVVDVDLAALERGNRLAARCETLGRGEELVETDTGVGVCGGPVRPCGLHRAIVTELAPGRCRVPRRPRRAPNL